MGNYTEKHQTGTILEALTTYLENRYEVIAAYLHGSYATGRQNHHSDVDIAIHTLPFKDRIENFNARVRYQRDNSDILKKNVDIALLQETGEMLTYQISGGFFMNGTKTRTAPLQPVKSFCIWIFSFWRNSCKKG